MIEDKRQAALRRLQQRRGSVQGNLPSMATSTQHTTHAHPDSSHRGPSDPNTSSQSPLGTQPSQGAVLQASGRAGQGTAKQPLRDNKGVLIEDKRQAALQRRRQRELARQHSLPNTENLSQFGMHASQGHGLGRRSPSGAAPSQSSTQPYAGVAVQSPIADRAGLSQTSTQPYAGIASGSPGVAELGPRSTSFPANGPSESSTQPHPGVAHGFQEVSLSSLSSRLSQGSGVFAGGTDAHQLSQGTGIFADVDPDVFS